MINVVAAVIKDENEKILITQRNLKKAQGGLWEFPGGKIEHNETRENAIVREIKEELDIDIEVKSYLSEKVFKYPEKDINLIALECKKINGEIRLLEHEDYKWVSKNELDNFQFAPADLFIIEKIKSMIDTEEIIKQAEKFYDVAKECIGPKYNNGWYIGNRELSEEELEEYLFPKETVTATVNISFCCELLLKSMLNTGDIIKEHRLKELFDMLDNSWKEIIIKKMGYEENENTFYNRLDKISNCFVEWRYIYEKPKEERRINFSFLNQFAIILMLIAHAKFFFENDEKDKIHPTDLILIEIVLNKK